MIRDTYHDGVSRPKVRKVRARRPGSWPIAESDGDAATRRHRPAHRVLGGDHRRQREHGPRDAQGPQGEGRVTGAGGLLHGGLRSRATTAARTLSSRQGRYNA